MSLLEDDKDLIQKPLKELEPKVATNTDDGSYPKNALKLGTFVRSLSHDRLGVVTDAFYGESDEVGEKIIVYTIILFPNTGSIANIYKKPENFFMSNEYEYDVIGYLMMRPVNLPKLMTGITGEMFL
jgi:hypothetical protein|tara:strand:- start:93 stop:473 length:381 start_codon:yes stop_codon:yes gene_type:complete